jgi:hypothetical protein
MKRRIIIVIMLMIILTGCSNQEPIQEFREPEQPTTVDEVVEAEPTAVIELTPTETPLPTPTKLPPPSPTPEPVPIPDPRYMHNMVYDEASDTFVLFGGTNSVECDYKADTWIYDLKNLSWTEMNPPVSPPEGQGTMAYDLESDRVILFSGVLAMEYTKTSGGADSDVGTTAQRCIPFEEPGALNPGGETWVYDDQTNEWTRIESADTPFGLQGTRMVYNTAADRMILFGGWYVGEGPNKGASDETWAFDFNSATWTKMSPEVSPPGRMDHAMAYDSESDRVIVWGGGGPIPMDVGDIWAYDYNSDTWEELESDDAPRQKRYMAMVYDAGNDQAILYRDKELWGYDYNSNAWSLISGSPGPGKRSWHAMAYYPVEGQILQFGGGGNYGTWKNRTWIYDINSGEWEDLTRR